MHPGTGVTENATPSQSTTHHNPTASDNTVEPSHIAQNGSKKKQQQKLDGEGKPMAAPRSKSTSNPKDLSRPRRKKARRACFACQRAHLTCGMLLVDLIPAIAVVTNFFVFFFFTRRRETLLTLHQARAQRCLPRWCAQEGQVSARYS